MEDVSFDAFLKSFFEELAKMNPFLTFVLPNEYYEKYYGQIKLDM